MHRPSFSSKIEAKLKQIILSDLICAEYGHLYKHHTQALLNWLNLLSIELKISTSDQKILLAAGYGYHWGCTNLFNQLLEHHYLLEHTASCYSLASSKLERLLGYYNSKFFSQTELLRIAKILLDQSDDSLGSDQLAILLFEASVISWAEILLDNDMIQVSKQAKKDLIENAPVYLENNRLRFINDVSKQALATLM